MDGTDASGSNWTCVNVLGHDGADATHVARRSLVANAAPGAEGD
jgi:hypothetical protein